MPGHWTDLNFYVILVISSKTLYLQLYVIREWPFDHLNFSSQFVPAKKFFLFRKKFFHKILAITGISRMEVNVIFFFSRVSARCWIFSRQLEVFEPAEREFDEAGNWK